MNTQEVAEAGQRLARGGHTDECEWVRPRQYAGVTLGEGGRCTCGWRETVAIIQQALREWVPREDRERAALLADNAGAAAGAKARRLLKLEDTP